MARWWYTRKPKRCDVHEFPEVQAMVRQALAQVPPGSRIRLLRITVGEASGHDPHHIHEHFLEASRGTAAEGAELQFLCEKLAAKCAKCGTEFNTGEMGLMCSRCGSTRLLITAGNNVRLDGVEVES
jgi:hydrogenase nickel incorporation protein HypA/HybF